MIFSSFEFIIFFIFFFLLIRFLPKFQSIIIILGSLFFYSYWNPLFTSIIIYLVLCAYFFSNVKLNLAISIIFILVPLAYFKYSFFFLVDVFNISNYLPTWFVYSGDLPLGISFVTFTVIALTIDSKKNIYKGSKKLTTISSFILYFPQLIAGPILRGNQLVPLLTKKFLINSDNIRFGLTLFLVGFFKKIFLADNIGLVIDPAFANPMDFSNEFLLISVMLYPLQIYFDFSGYIDMALGISNIFGVNLPINFNKPYLTKSIREFWRCWHITLSSWFRDYVYIPLGGSRKNFLITNINLILTMSIAGLWHGANWNFLIWGCAHGIFLCIERINWNYFNLKKVNPIFKIVINCFIIFNLWILFRANNLSDLYFILSEVYFIGKDILSTKLLFVFFILLFGVWSQKFDNYEYIRKMALKIEPYFLIFLIFSVLMAGFLLNAGMSEKFIYFDF